MMRRVSNAKVVAEAGADCLAVVSAVCSADDPASVAQEFKNIMDDVMKHHG
jgi:thiamine-phosphate pyrophosphorylase